MKTLIGTAVLLIAFVGLFPWVLLLSFRVGEVLGNYWIWVLTL